MLTGGQLRAVGVAGGSGVIASVVYYTSLNGLLARHHEAYAGDVRPPPWLLPVELARSTTVATAVAVLADRIHAQGPVDTVRLGLGLWAAFPVVLLTGSVVHEKVPWQVATVHGGDWLIKLLLMSVLAGRQSHSSARLQPRPRRRFR